MVIKELATVQPWSFKRACAKLLCWEKNVFGRSTGTASHYKNDHPGVGWQSCKKDRLSVHYSKISLAVHTSWQIARLHAKNISLDFQWILRRFVCRNCVASWRNFARMTLSVSVHCHCEPISLFRFILGILILSLLRHLYFFISTRIIVLHWQQHGLTDSYGCYYPAIDNSPSP